MESGLLACNGLTLTDLPVRSVSNSSENLGRKREFGRPVEPVFSIHWGATQPVESSIRSGTVPMFLPSDSAETVNCCQPGNFVSGAAP